MAVPSIPLAARRFAGLDAPRLAAAGGALAALLGVAAAALLIADAISAPERRSTIDLPQLVGTFAFGLPGALAAARRPGNAVGWISLAIGLVQGFSAVCWGYALRAADGAPGGLPAGNAALWVGDWAWVPGYLLVPTLLLLHFPDGRLPGPRWRAVAWASGAGIVLATVGRAITPYGEHDGWDAPFPAGASNPFAVADPAPVTAVAVAVLLPSVAACLASLAVRVRRARATERRQVQIVLLAALLVAILLALGQVVGEASPVLVGLAMLPLPAATAFAVVRHGLWDLEVAVRRSLVWGVLTAAVVACYAVVVEGVGAALGERRGAALAATGLVAVGILPLRTRVQGAVNRLLYGERDDPESVLARLGSRLEEAVTADEVLPGIAQTIAGALRLPYVEVRVADHAAGVHGVPGATPPLRLPLVHRGEPVGELLAAPRDADGFGRGDRAALERLVGQVAVAAHAVRLAGELQRARERLVLAREEERRRLRRDLHDELGPTLAALALELEEAHDLAAADPELGQRLERLAARARAGVGDVRRLAHDLRPPALDDLGLVGALQQLTARAGTPVTIAAGELGALPAAVEVAAYRIVLEALANVARHAGAGHAEVRLERRDGALLVVVSDDGRGIAPDRSEGVGLRSLRERAAELGGRATVGPAADGGTEVRALLPLKAAP